MLWCFWNWSKSIPRWAWKWSTGMPTTLPINQKNKITLLSSKTTRNTTQNNNNNSTSLSMYPHESLPAKTTNWKLFWCNWYRKCNLTQCFGLDERTWQREMPPKKTTRNITQNNNINPTSLSMYQFCHLTQQQYIMQVNIQIKPQLKNTWWNWGLFPFQDFWLEPGVTQQQYVMQVNIQIKPQLKNTEWNWGLFPFRDFWLEPGDECSFEKHLAYYLMPNVLDEKLENKATTKCLIVAYFFQCGVYPDGLEPGVFRCTMTIEYC